MPTKRVTVSLALDLIAFIDLVLLGTTGSIMRWVLPPGSGGGRGSGFRGGRDPGPATGQVKQLLGLGRHDWGDVHFVLALTFVLLILMHIVLHWTWIKTCGKAILFPSCKAPCDPGDEPDEIS